MLVIPVKSDSLESVARVWFSERRPNLTSFEYTFWFWSTTMTASPLEFIEGNWVLSTACALSDSEFGTLRLLADTLNETEEKKLEMSGADTRRTSTQTTTITRYLLLIRALSGSKNEWLVFINGVPFVPALDAPLKG